MRTAFALLCAASVPLLASSGASCTDLANTRFGPDITIQYAGTIPAEKDLPEHCEVRGVIWPEGRFVVKLPANWNQRFQMVGNGGWAGTISNAAVDTAI